MIAKPPHSATASHRPSREASSNRPMTEHADRDRPRRDLGFVDEDVVREDLGGCLERSVIRDIHLPVPALEHVPAAAPADESPRGWRLGRPQRGWPRHVERNRDRELDILGVVVHELWGVCDWMTPRATVNGGTGVPRGERSAHDRCSTERRAFVEIRHFARAWLVAPLASEQRDGSSPAWPHRGGSRFAIAAAPPGSAWHGHSTRHELRLAIGRCAAGQCGRVRMPSASRLSTVG